MKISYNQLKKLIHIDQTPEELGVILTNTGLEVEGIEKIDAVKGGLEGLVVGFVESCSKHPDADKLSCTKVDVGGENLLDIVCGAPNVAAGQKVIVALVGAMLYPNEGEPFQIKKSKIRGEVSEGMLCAEDEIGLGRSHAGILVLDTDLAPGSPIASIFKLEPDYQIEIGLTPNRADAASHYGVARDIKAVTKSELVLPSIADFKLGNAKGTITLDVQDADACKRFCGLEIRGIQVQESPAWLKQFLGVIGVNAINNIVDITNYICHFLGQPMHIFDADELGGKQVVVRVPLAGEKIITLDGTERTFTGKELAICDANKPMAIAGVFGGKNSGVKDGTQNIFLEVAYFDPTWVRRASTIHGLKTDASFRYERGTDPNMPPMAIRLAALMVQELAGGEICNEIFDFYPSPIENLIIDLKVKNINRLIGKNIGLDTLVEILEALDIRVLEKSEISLKVSVPPYRVDVTREADVIEEILRIYGFDNIELSEHLNSDFFASFPVKEPELTVFTLADKLVGLGLSEIQNLSIVKPADNAWAGDEAKTVNLLNPLSEDLSQMRRSLLFSGLTAIQYNINRRSKDLRFFEFGRFYIQNVVEGITKPKEHKVLAIWLTGSKSSESWMQKATEIDFASLNQVVQEVLLLMKCKPTESVELSDNQFSTGLELKLNQKSLVKFGKLNAAIKKYADIKQDVYYAAFDWDLLFKNYNPAFKFSELSKFPEVRRDLSLVLDKSCTFGQIEKIAFAIEKKLLTKVNVFDIYEGEKLAEGKKSYSVSFILQDNEKTLVDAIIDKTMNKLMAAFETELGAVIRK
jgi:phenylalanyl-tRNA synthetase beta chain